jgi:Flp pilus assembly protein TadD
VSRPGTLLLAAILATAITARAQQPDSVAALAAQARQLISQGKITSALTLIGELQKRGPSDPEAEYAAGEILQELAALRAGQLQRVAPDSPEAHELLGKSYEAQGKLEDALAEYRRALEKAPGKAGLHFLIGNVEWKLRNIDDARHEFSEELKTNPHHAMANLRMGEILLDTQRDSPAEAIAHLQEAANGAPASLEVHRELGKALRIAHRYPEAEKQLQIVEAQSPNDPTVHAQLAALYKEMGEQPKARDELAIHARLLREKLRASQQTRTGTGH